jgi:acyl-CoA thioesterase-1
MSRAPDRFFIRRGLVLGIAASTAAPAFAARKRVVTILGDSITAGFGLPAAAALPAQLGLALARLGTPVVVRGAGVSGDTTEDGLGRLNF